MGWTRDARVAARSICWVAVAGVLLAGCVDPDERRPGLWLSGEEAPHPADWSFSDAHHEIALEVAAPYGLAHSVTVWCASVDGALYVSARDPNEKRWPGWVEDDPQVRLAIDGKLYEGELVRLSEPDAISVLEGAYRVKYDLPPRRPEDAPPMRYWRVAPRSG